MQSGIFLSKMNDNTVAIRLTKDFKLIEKLGYLWKNLYFSCISSTCLVRMVNAVFSNPSKNCTHYTDKTHIMYIRKVEFFP